MRKLEKNWLEWVVFACGLVLTLGTLGYLGYDALTSQETPPRFTIDLGEPKRHVEDGKPEFTVPVAVFNQGQTTAEGVHVEVTLETIGKESETADFEFPFLPRHSKREGSVTFTHDPRNGELTARVLGYQKP